jgi:hypothetical protein
MPKVWSNAGAYAKGIVAVAGAVITSLAPVYGTQHWYAAMTAGLGALAVVLVPNSGRPAATLTATSASPGTGAVTVIPAPPKAG